MSTLAVSRILAVGFLVAAMALGLAKPASAEDLSLAAFEGRWQGSGVSESAVSIAFRMSARDLDVEVRRNGDGFTMAWTTVQRQKGDPNNPAPERKASELAFSPSSRPGVWRAGDGVDLLAGGTYAWSRIEDSTLVTHVIGIDDEGRSDVQVFRRTLSGIGMELDFRRVVDGEVVRTVSGKLIKIAK
jgi:hypothetical protein